MAADNPISACEKRLVKELLDLIDTPNLCKVVRSIYLGGVNANNREDAELLLSTFAAEKILLCKRIPISFILKFLISKNVNIQKPNVERYELCLAFRALIESQPDFIPSPSQYMQPIQPVANNMVMLSQNNNMMRGRYQPPASLMYMPAESTIPTISTMVPNTKSKKEVLEGFIEMFAGDFYKLLNNLGNPEKEQLNKNHFFENCMLALQILGGSEEIVENCEDSTSTLRSLLDFKTQHQLFFSPNLGDGVKWNKESHGMVRVIIGGTLHQGGSRMVGLFEQLFMLREDPEAANSWKILKTNLNCKSLEAYTTGPKLCIQGSETNHLQIDNV